MSLADFLSCMLYILTVWVAHSFLCAVGYQMEAEPLSIFGTHKREIEKEVTKKVDTYVNMLMQSAQDCEGEGVIYTA